MRIKGLFDFSSLTVPDSPYANSRETLNENIKRLEEKVRWVTEWISIKNILEYHHWEDLPSGDVHIVIKRERVVRLKEGDHIGEAAEVRIEE